VPVKSSQAPVGTVGTEITGDGATSDPVAADGDDDPGSTLYHFEPVTDDSTGVNISVCDALLSDGGHELLPVLYILSFRLYTLYAKMRAHTQHITSYHQHNSF